jgi:hypothetical protein
MTPIFGVSSGVSVRALESDPWRAAGMAPGGKSRLVAPREKARSPRKAAWLGLALNRRRHSHPASVSRRFELGRAALALALFRANVL